MDGIFYNKFEMSQMAQLLLFNPTTMSGIKRTCVTSTFLNSICSFSAPSCSHRLAPVIFELGRDISWEETNNSEYPYKTKVKGEEVILRYNSEWPDRDLFTAIDKDGRNILEISAIKEYNGYTWIPIPKE